MKKSKVIVPAMALLLFSTAASITGTVAWFSSTRSFQLSASQFAVKEVEGGLEAAVKGGVGTEAKKKDGTNLAGTSYLGTGSDFDVTAEKIVVKDKHDLTHGSFDAIGKHAYIVNRDSTGTSDMYKDKGSLLDSTDATPVPGAETTFADPTKTHKAADSWYVTQLNEGTTASPEIHYYYVAFSWTIRFVYDFHSETNDIGVYLNLKDSSITHADSASDTAEGKLTIKGFRVAFLPVTAGVTGNTFVWGKNSDSGDATRLNYVEGAASTNVAAYNSTGKPKYFNTDSDYTKVDDATNADGDSANKAKEGRMFTLKKPTSGSDTSSYCDVKCVAWFEGEDSNIKSGARMDKVDVSMSFYARSDYSINGTVITG